MTVALDILCFISAIVFSVMTLRTMICLHWAQRLPPLEVPPISKARVSVVLAARDEGARVEGTIRRILAQQHVELEIIPVDDRSRDCTSQILKSLSAEDSRVRPKRVDTLPEDWLGKSHACHLGASSATGEWLLFMDADCWLKPDTLARALVVAEREKVQHITLTPGVTPATIPAEAWHIAFLITVADWIARVNRDHPKGYLGVGAFNLVRTETYRAFGGHETLRLTVVDDVKLGKLVRRSGGRTRAFIGGDDVECHWGVTVREMIKIMEKNYFAAVDYRTSVGLFVGIVVMLFWCVAIVGSFTGRFLGVAAGAALFSSAIPAVIISRRLGWRIWGALFAPFVLAALFYAVLNSTIITLKQGGIRWRDTFYPLEKLRKGNVY
jgi:glycosyltransferase involved in cell wall biosynthesis